MAGIPEDIRHTHTKQQEWDDLHAQHTDWETENHRSRPVLRRGTPVDDDYVTDLITRLNETVRDAQGNNVRVMCSIHAEVSEDRFTELASTAERVEQLTSGVSYEPGFRIAEWGVPQGPCVTLFKDGAA